MTEATSVTGNGNAAGGVIHDLGYRGYDGVRLGRGAVFRALYSSSLRSAFGLGRGGKAKIIPFLAVGIMALPAMITVVVLTTLGEAIGDQADIIQYRQYAFAFQPVILGFLAVQAAELICRDLRFNVLPLYFSRPIKRTDYPLAKLLAMATALFIVISTPLIVQYVGAVFTTEDGLDGIWTETERVAPILVSAVVHGLVLGALGLAIASFTPRRPYAIGGIAAWYVVTNVLTGILFGVLASQTENGEPDAEWPALLTPFGMLNGFQNAALGVEPAPTEAGSYAPLFIGVTIVFFAACVAILMWRYRRVGR
ncbi:MAG: ABC transporter permease [Sporichthyaceae bacterium]|nr:ABC transporter permease [Sporichthyaceae bacterium]